MTTVVSGPNLSTEEARGAVEIPLRGDAQNAELGALLVLMPATGETATRIIGVSQASRQRMIPVHAQRGIQQ